MFESAVTLYICIYTTNSGPTKILTLKIDISLLKANFLCRSGSQPLSVNCWFLFNSTEPVNFRELIKLSSYIKLNHVSMRRVFLKKKKKKKNIGLRQRLCRPRKFLE